MLAEEIRDHIHLAGIAIKAVNLFIGLIPTGAPLPAIGILETGGGPPEEVHDLEGVALEHPSFQVTVRGANDLQARAKIREVWDLLVKVTNQDLSGVRYLHIGARQSPQFLETDENSKSVYVANFDCVKVPS